MKSNMSIPSSQEQEEDKVRPWYAVDENMISSKLSYIFENAKQSCHLPYMMLFFMSIGLDPGKAGLVNGLRFIGYIVGAPLLGYIADKIKIHRIMITAICILATITMCSQPMLSIVIGEEENNVCPIPAKQVNQTSNENVTSSNGESLFYILLSLNIIATIFDGSTQSFVDAGVMKRIKNSPTPVDFGKQRYFGALGFGSGAFLSSLAIDYFPALGISCYAAVFCVYCACTFILAMSTNALYKGPTCNKVDEENHNNLTKLLRQTLLQFDTVFFLLSVLIVGTIHAFYVSFLFVYMKEMAAANVVMGLSITFGAIGATMCFAFSMQIIKLVGGTIHTMCLGCFSWCIRLLCNYYITKPELVLLTQLLHGLGFALFVTAAIQHVKYISSPTILATMYGIMNSLFFGASFIIGNVAGGIIYKVMGVRNLFLATSIASGIWTLVMIMYICCRKDAFREKQELELSQVTKDCISLTEFEQMMETCV